MDENPEPIDASMKRRLHGHYEAYYGPPSTPEETWGRISAQMPAPKEEPLLPRTQPRLEIVALDHGQNLATKPRFGQAAPLALVATLALVVASVVIAWFALRDAPPKDDPNATTEQWVPGKALVTEITPGEWVMRNLASGPNPRLPDYEKALRDSGGPDGGQVVEVASSAQVPETAAGGYASLQRLIVPDEYLGKRLRFSVQVKTEGVEEWARIFMKVEGATTDRLLLDDIAEQRLPANAGWERYWVVLDVPNAANTLSFGIQLSGKGKVSVGPAQVEVVDLSVPVTDAPAARNLDHEQGFAGWEMLQDEGYYRDIVTYTHKVGESSARLYGGRIDGLGTFWQVIRADEYAGKRLRLSAQVKTEDVEQRAGLWMQVHSNRLDMGHRQFATDNMGDRPISGTRDWERYEIVLDVPRESTHIAFGVRIYGRGDLWMDDIKLVTAGNNVAVTGQPILTYPVNLSFEEGLTGWFNAGGGYITEVGSSGCDTWSNCATLRPRDGAGTGRLTQVVSAGEYRGKQVRLSGRVKTSSVGVGTGLWLDIIGPNNIIIKEARPSPALITGTNDWSRYDIVVDIPEEAEYLSYGLLLENRLVDDRSEPIPVVEWGEIRTIGMVWADDLKLEVTNLSEPQDMGFEEGGQVWRFNVSSDPTAGGIVTDVARTGTASAYLATGNLLGQTLWGAWQEISASQYHGKRVRFSMYIKTRDLEGTGGISIYLSNKDPIGQQSFVRLGYVDSQDGPPLQGANDWRQYSVVAEVPPEATNILLGFHMRGKGTMWVDDATFEVIEDDAPLRGEVALREPTNLSFEDGLSGWYEPSHTHKAAVDKTAGRDGRAAASVEVSNIAIEGGSYLGQTLFAQQYRGKTVRLSAYIKTERGTEQASLTISAMGHESRRLVPVSVEGTGEWKQYQVDLSIPEDILVIQIGVQILGEGNVWIDDVAFEVLDTSSPTP